MKPLPENNDFDAGSRMHVLDWVGSPDFLPSLRELAPPASFTIAENAAFQPKGRYDFRESILTEPKNSFLSPAHQDELLDWWLVHKRGARLPTWDLVVCATDIRNRPALVLVEAKAHVSELSTAGKTLERRDTPEQQARTDANHRRIGDAIAEAAKGLHPKVPKVSLSRDESYQFSNRVAFAWKLATLGLPVALIYLGFIGDDAIASNAEDRISTDEAWRVAFGRHTRAHFSVEKWDQEIQCGTASFWLLVRSRKVARQSPPKEERRTLK